MVWFYNSSHACFLTAFLQEKEKTDKEEVSRVLCKESDHPSISDLIHKSVLSDDSCKELYGVVRGDNTKGRLSVNAVNYTGHVMRWDLVCWIRQTKQGQWQSMEIILAY